jgi:disulfide bond formation protein DsbB
MLVVWAVALTHLLGLDPCSLCIFQRLLDLGLAALLLAVAFAGVASVASRIALPVALAIALGGVAVTVHQSWLQYSPPAMSCGPAHGPIDQVVGWLGEQAPYVFLATGTCESKELVIFGLSLANWSLLSYLGFTVLIAVLAIAAFGSLRRGTT